MASKLLLLPAVAFSLCFVGALSFSQNSYVDLLVGTLRGASSSIDRRRQVPTRRNLSKKLSIAPSPNQQERSSTKTFNPCPEPDNNPDMDRREAAFAMLGSLWVAGAVPAAVLPAALSNAQPAYAEYGTDAKIQLPNPMEQMRERATKQCLMESLGNRECLVYEDPDNKLYQNPDTKVLVERVEKAGEALATIPELIESKNWIKVTGVLTGPMGTLANSMDLLSKASDNPSTSAEKAKKVKTDLYGISGSVDRRNGSGALEYHKLATEHLVDYIKSL